MFSLNHDAPTKHQENLVYTQSLNKIFTFCYSIVCIENLIYVCGHYFTTIIHVHKSTVMSLNQAGIKPKK